MVQEETKILGKKFVECRSCEKPHAEILFVKDRFFNLSIQCKSCRFADYYYKCIQKNCNGSIPIRKLENENFFCAECKTSYDMNTIMRHIENKTEACDDTACGSCHKKCIRKGKGNYICTECFYIGIDLRWYISR